MLERNHQLEKDVVALKSSLASSGSDDILDKVIIINGINVISEKIDNIDAGGLRILFSVWFVGALVINKNCVLSGADCVDVGLAIAMFCIVMGVFDVLAGLGLLLVSIGFETVVATGWVFGCTEFVATVTVAVAVMLICVARAEIRA